MKSLLITPKTQTGIVVKTTLYISTEVNHTTPIFTKEYAVDKDILELEEKFLNKPLFIKVLKELQDGTHIEYKDENPVVRSNTLVLAEDLYNTNVDAEIEQINQGFNYRITLNRPVDNVLVTILDAETLKVLEVITSNGNVIDCDIKANASRDGEVLFKITSSIKGIKLKTITKTKIVPNTKRVTGLTSVYYLDSVCNIVVVPDGKTYTISIDDVIMGISNSNTYDLKPYLDFGSTHILYVEFSDGITLEYDIETRNTLKNFNKDKIIEGVQTDTGLQIDTARLTSPYYGDMGYNTMFYLINEDGKDALYSYYVPSDISRKLNPDFTYGNKIEEVFFIDDRTLGLLVSGTALRGQPTYKLVIYKIYLAPLLLTEINVIEFNEYARTKLTFLHATKEFFYINNDKMFKMSLDGVIDISITTPVSFTKGYITTSSITDLAVILDGVLYIYDVVTDDWDTIKALTAPLKDKTFKYLTYIPEGFLIVNTDFSLFKFVKKDSDFVELPTPIDDVNSFMRSNGNLFFTKNNTTKVYALN